MLLSIRMAHACVASALLMQLSGCGGGGGGDGPVGAEQAGPTTVIGGTFVATDGTTPMGKALVYVEGGKSRDGLAPATVACGTPPDASWPATCTAADGSFSFEVQLPAGASLVLAKNGFVQRSTLLAGQASVALGALKLDPATAGASIAVVLGDDTMHQVLARLGMGTVNPVGQLVYGTETFKVYDSEAGQDSVQALRQYPSWDQLFVDRDGNGKPDIYDRAVVVFNAGLYDSLRADPNRMQMLRDFVNQGGRLITGGVGFYLIEDLWPEYLDWAGVDAPAGVPERPQSLRSEASVTPVFGRADADFATWLSGRVCMRYLVNIETGSCFDVPSDSMFVVDAVATEVLPNAYARLLGPHAQSAALVRTLVTGFVDVAGTMQQTHPLAVVMNVGAGRVAYTTFQIEPAAQVSGITPHERMFQYLVFEM
jgi:hypothetical protein